MYQRFYGLSRDPFDPALQRPDTVSLRNGIACLRYGLMLGEGVLLVTGEAGSGCTTVLRRLIDGLDPGQVNVIAIAMPADSSTLLRAICAGLDVLSSGMSSGEMLAGIERALAHASRRLLVAIDDADALDDDGIATLHTLAWMPARIQLALTGGPAFGAQLADRVIAHHHGSPMTATEVERYLAARLEQAGWRGNPDILPDAVTALHRASCGVADRLDHLMQAVLEHGATRGITAIDAAHVQAAIGSDAAPPPRIVRPFIVDTPADDALLLTERICAPDEEMPDPRITAIEARMAAQEGALRRILAMMVEQIEGAAGAPCAREARLN